ncbi:MAG: hypothetical protein OEO77_05005, partial [Acidimicrobiia bacterium]|nr:hypothetical protein [Acidimicrobiia bacterium]
MTPAVGALFSAAMFRSGKKRSTLRMRRGETLTTPRRSSPRRVALLAGFALFVSACSSGGPLDSLDPQGPIAEDIDGLFRLTLYIAIAI